MSAPFDFRVLGPVRALRGGEPMPLGGSKRRSVLALLIANRNRVVSVSSIADALWDEDPPPSVSSSIQVAVSGLRSALAVDEPVAGRPLIETAPPGYRLVIDESACDLGRFLIDRNEARAAHGRGELDKSAALYRRALDEWSGHAYEDLRDMRFACELSVALDEERLATVESRIEVELAAGKHRDLVGELAGLTADNPLRESLWTAYMTALFRCDRQADALAAYRLLRTTLMDELGLDPSPAARRLESAILAQDASLAWTPAAVVVPAAPPPDLTMREPVDSPPAQLLTQDGKRIPLDGSGLRFGRVADNTFVIDDPKVSRYHAAIAATDEAYVLTDLHSTNGTRLNGLRISSPQVLADGDEIAIAGVTLRYVISAGD